MNDKYMQFINTFIEGQGICKDKGVYLLYAKGVIDSHPFWSCHNNMVIDYEGFPDWSIDR